MSNTIENMSSSDYNLQKINTKQLEQHLTATIEMGGNMFLCGMRGIGKTAISKQVIQKCGCREVYVNLSLFERTDLAGYPLIFQHKEHSDLKQQFVDYMLPRMFEPLMMGDKPVVILFDEVDKADPSIWAPLLEITQFKSINGTALPNLRSSIMTANLISEGAGSKPIDPLLDRAEKFLLETEINTYLEWAGANQTLHASVFQFLADHPSMLCDKNTVAENYGGRSPRGWELSSKMTKFGEEHHWPADLILEKVAAYVGKKAGLEYMTYYAHYQTLLPIVKKVFSHQGEALKEAIAEYKKLSPSEKTTVCIIIGAKFASSLDQYDPKKEQPEVIKTVGTFFQHIREPEQLITTLRSQVKLARITSWRLIKNEHWRELLQDLNSYMPSAKVS